MNNALKQRGFNQGLYDTSTVQKEALGTLRITADGRKFRYAKAGGTVNKGQMTLAATVNANHANEAILAAVPIGTTALELTVTAGTAIAANQLKDGYLTIQDGTGEGQIYLIVGNSAITNAETVINIALAEPILTALDTTSEFTLCHNPFYGVTHSATGEQLATGISLVAVTSGDYFWAQTGGPCVWYNENGTTAAVGTNMVVGTTTSGSVTPATSGIDIDLPIVGYAWGTAGASLEYTPGFLTID